MDCRQACVPGPCAVQTLLFEVVEELDRVSGEASGPLVLDLTNLGSADAAGLRALGALMKQGAEIRGASPYIRMRLESASE